MKAPLSVDEIVGVLKRSSLPTLLVEGDDDIIVWRWMQEQFSALNISVLQCGGREQLIEVFRRRSEFSSTRVSFVADSDVWFFKGVPLSLRGINFTKGYSIENDLVEDAELINLLDSQERGKFHSLLNEIAPWFASQIELAIANSPIKIDIHINELCPPDSSCIDPKFAHHLPLDPLLQSFISSQWMLAFRGKLLWQALVRFLSRPRRQSKYSYINLLEIASSLRRGLNIYSLTKAIANDLNLDLSHGSASSDIDQISLEMV